MRARTPSGQPPTMTAPASTPTPPSDPAGPVTMVVTRHVKPGREAEYEAWLRDLIAVGATMPGYLGTHVERPAPGAPGRYRSIYRFDSLATLEAFEQSDARRAAMARVADLAEPDPAWERLTGLEVWFQAPPGAVVPQPSRARMALLVIGVVYLLVLTLGAVVPLLLPGAPLRLRQFVMVVAQVLIMTYVVMPRLARWFARFVYPAR